MSRTRAGSECSEKQESRPFAEAAVVKHIGIVSYDGFSLLEAGTVAEVLHVANQVQSKSAHRSISYSVRFVSAIGGAIACSSSLCVWTERLGGQQFRQFDTVIISGGAGVAAAAKDESFISLLAIVCSQSSSICPIGNGHVLLSATGLARQDWASAVRDSLRESPAALSRHGRDEALMISLSLVKRDLGSTVARTVVEHLDLDHDRPLPIELESVATLTPAEKAQGSARWLERNCERAIAVSDAARTAAMSERNFLRLFKREIGLTPSEYLLRVRLDLVCQRLLQTDLPIDKIARRTGLSNGERLSKLFRRRFSASPTEYRLNGLNRIQHRDDLAVDGPEEKRTACPSSSEAAL